MVRPLRLEYPGAVYHVMSRGDARKSITRAETDRPLFLKVLKEATEKYNVLIHSYCLMTNHYHLLIETPDGNLSVAMRHINGVYTQRSNARNKTVGHIFQGRYKAIVVERDEYLLELCRYIVLNPVRAGIVTHPGDWQWSSYGKIAGLDKGADPFLEIDWILSQFSNTRELAQKAYSEFVISAMASTDNPFDHVVGGCMLGTEGFLKKFDDSIWEAEQISDIIRSHRYANRPPILALFENCDQGRARDACIYAAVVEFGYSQTEVASFLGLHRSTISRIINRGTGKGS
jgi:putative transposase